MKNPACFSFILKLMGLIVGFGGAMAFIPWSVGYAYLKPLPDMVRTEVDSAVGKGLEGVIVYVDQAGKAPVLYAAGWNDREAKNPADPHALFKIGSISKLYIATAAVKLVAAKRLSLDNTLAELLPEIAPRIAHADTITLRMLLSHRSGIPEYVNTPGFAWDLKMPQMLALVLDRPADFKPGKRYRYSNSNYLLIGLILDKVLGYSHNDYIRSEILMPLGLKCTYSRFGEVTPAEVMSGYAVNYGPDLKALDFTIAGGSMVATARDVGIFLRALNDGSLLNRQEQGIYTSVYPYEHTGLLPGYQSFARYDRETDTVIVVFVNTSGGNSWMKSEALVHRLLRIVRKDHKDL